MTKLWARFMCGGCGRGFTADPDTVPMLGTEDHGNWPCCLPCWNLRNRMRERLSLPANDRPLSYPEDFSEQ